MKPKVFFKKGTHEDFFKNPQLVLDGFERLGLSAAIKKNDFLGLKIHFGERGNKSFINPNYLFKLAHFLKESGAKAFLFDTNTLYHGRRGNSVDHLSIAAGHGFGKLNLPIMIGDGMKGADFIEKEIYKKHFEKCYLAAILKDIDSLIVLSHMTGHMLTGFGCAVKNLGMGCAARRGKLAQHCTVSPFIHKDRCVACGACFANCSVAAIDKQGDKYAIVGERRIGCAQCLSVCRYGAVDISWANDSDFISEKVAEYAYAAAKSVKNCVYANFLLYVTTECDCMNKEDEGFIPDIGVLFSDDPVAIDKAGVDLILAQNQEDPLKKAHPQINYLRQLEYGQSIGLGAMDYELVEI